MQDEENRMDQGGSDNRYYSNLEPRREEYTGYRQEQSGSGYAQEQQLESGYTQGQQLESGYTQGQQLESGYTQDQQNGSGYVQNQEDTSTQEADQSSTYHYDQTSTSGYHQTNMNGQNTGNPYGAQDQLNQNYNGQTAYGSNGYSNNGQYYNSNEPKEKEHGTGFAITALILGIISILCFCGCINFITAIAAIIFAIIHLVRSDAGKGMAITGIVLAAISIIGGAVFWIFALTTTDFKNFDTNGIYYYNDFGGDSSNNEDDYGNDYNDGSAGDNGSTGETPFTFEESGDGDTF